MFEVSENSKMPLIGRMQPIRVLASLSRRFFGTPSSNHSFQVFIDRLFRIAGLGNWLPQRFGAASRTTITGPAE
jgi:hypothetical protein